MSHNNPNYPTKNKAENNQRKILFDRAQFINEFKKRYGKYLLEAITCIVSFAITKSILITSIILFGVIILHLSYLWSNQQKIFKFKSICIIIGIFTASIFTLPLLYFTTDIFKPNPPKKPCENPQTLYEEFICDFDSPIDNLLSNTLIWEDSIKTHYKVRLNQDFNSKSCFLSIYIYPSLYTYSACLYLAEYCDTLVRTIKNISLTSPEFKIPYKPTDVEINETRFKDLVFTRIVHIYYEIPLFSEQIDSLKVKYKSQNLTPYFHNYLVIISPTPNK